MPGRQAPHATGSMHRGGGVSVLRTFRVATFYDVGPGRPVKSRVRTYTRDYNPQWEGCIVYDVLATSAKEARAEAVQGRLDHELARWLRGTS